MVESPWYAEGLRFECTQCGQCCTGSPGFVWVDVSEIVAIANYLDRPVGEIRLLHTRPARGKVSLTEFANGDCTFLDPQTRKCQVYPVRPQQCRTWPFWKGNVSSPAGWAKTCEECPGANHGRLYDLAEIEQQLNQSPI